MMIFGVLGYLVRKFDLNPAAIVLALILGPIGENGLRRSLRLSGGSPAIPVSYTHLRVVSEEDMHVVFVCFHCHDFAVMGISDALNLLFYGINP